MVDVADGGSKDLLKKRVDKLTRELDGLDARYNKAIEAFRGTVTVLSGMLPDSLGKGTAAALDRFKKEVQKKPLKPEAAEKALEAIKTALMSEPTRGEAPVEVPEEPEAAAEESPELSEVSRHVALALLEGLRLGDQEFDALLDQSIDQVQGYVMEGKLRPAMVTLTDLLDSFRQTLDSKRALAEEALKEILSEIVSAEAELTDSLTKNADAWDDLGRVYHEKITASVGGLLKEINQAEDLDKLKITALDHIRGLRDSFKARRAHEQALVERSRQEVRRMRDALENTKKRMQQAEAESERLSEEALTCPVTKIWNKRALGLALAEMLDRPLEQPITLIVFDMDHFKKVNDNYGHRAGDKALIAIAARAKSCLRGGDSIYRYAGDEFVILLPKTGLSDAKGVAERVRQAAQAIRFTYSGDREMRVTISLGASQSKNGDTADTLFERADQALLEAKRQGRNRLVTG